MMERIVATFIAVAVALPATAAPLKYRPGKWTTKSTMQMTGMPAQTRTTTECLRDGEYSPDDIMKGQDGCTVDLPTVTDDTMHWAVSCRYPQGTAAGTGEFSVEEGGERGTGTVVITMKTQGREMTSTMRFETERVGECD